MKQLEDVGLALDELIQLYAKARDNGDSVAADAADAAVLQLATADAAIADAAVLYAFLKETTPS